MSLRNRTAAARKDQEERKSGLPKIKPDTYDVMLVESNHGVSKAGNKQFVLNFKILKGDETGRECNGMKFNVYYSEHLSWSMDNLFLLLEDLGVSLEWLDQYMGTEAETDKILEALEAADGTKGIRVFCKRNEKDEKRNNYYLNEAPCVLGDEEFGVNVFKGETTPPAEEKKPKKAEKKPAAKSKEIEPKEVESSKDEDEWDDSDWD